MRRATTKSRAPLLVGIAASALVLGIVAFFATRGKESSAGLEPAPAATTLSASSSAQPPSTPSMKPSGNGLKPGTALAAAQPLPASGWKPLFTEKEWQLPYQTTRKLFDGSTVPAGRSFKDGALHVQNNGYLKPQPATDVAIRARIVIQPGSDTGAVIARRSLPEGYYKWGTTRNDRSLELTHFKPDTNTSTMLGKHELPVALRPGDKLDLELLLQGPRLIALANGVVVIDTQDNRLKAAGECGIEANNAWFESVEVQPLPAAATPAPVAATWPSPTGWQPLLSQSEWQKSSKGTTDYQGKQVPFLREFQDGLLHISRSSLNGDQSFADGAIRAFLVMRDVEDSGFLAARGSAAGRYQFGILDHGRTLLLAMISNDDKSRKELGRYTLPQPLKPGERFTVELRLQGSQLTGLFNGREVVKAADPSLTGAGKWGLDVSEAWFESVEVQPLPVAAESWQNALADTAQLILSGGASVTPDGLLLTGESSQAWVLSGQARSDCAVRMRANTDGLRLGLRARMREGGSHYKLDLPGKATLKLQRWDNVARQSTVLREFPLPPGFDLSAEHEMELRVKGSTLTVSLDRQMLGKVTDTMFKSGPFGVAVGEPISKPVLIKSLEVLDLGVSSSPSPPVSKSSDPKFPPGQWVKLFTKPEDLPAELRKPDSGVTWEDGWIRAEGGYHVVSLPESLAQNYAIRARIRRKAKFDGKSLTEFKLRFSPVRPGEDYVSQYTLMTVSGSELVAKKWVKGEPTDLAIIKPPKTIEAGEEYTLEFGSVGSQLVGRLNSISLASTCDDSLPKGQMGLLLTEDIRDIEVINLDGLPEAEALRLLGVDEKGNDLRGKQSSAGLQPAPAPSTPSASKSAQPVATPVATGSGDGLKPSTTLATATKDAPFVNSLGMKFVPVPGTKVLFSIWDTRVQDYAAYAKAQEAAGKKVDGSWKTQQKDGVPVGREPDHPVVGVSWEDAQAFCQWLTAKEGAEGKLPKGHRYRLPTDEEWSTAVGLPPEQGTTPEDKNTKNSEAFPWGKDWPLTSKVGNYADETFHAQFPVKRNEKENRDENPWIQGYDDSFATTSPVGSFPPNALGLYDMGGNVWQWCEDRWNAEHNDRVLRGASWYYQSRRDLLSSYRYHSASGYRAGHYGFRCVLAIAPSSATASPSPNPPVSRFSTQFPPGQWVKVFTKAEDLPENNRTQFGVRFEEGWITPAANAMSFSSRSIPGASAGFATMKNGGIRALIRRNPSVSATQLKVRLTDDVNPLNPQIQLTATGEVRVTDSTVMDARIYGAWMPEPEIKAGQSYSLELVAVGTRVFARLNGRLISCRNTENFSVGHIGIWGFEPIRDIEVINLDGLPEAEALRLLGVDEQGNDLRGKTK